MSTCIGQMALTAVVAIAPVTLAAGCAANAPASAALCWRSLAPETGPQHLNVAMTSPTLAATGSGEIWLSWRETDTRMLRWAAGLWTSPPAPTRVGLDGMWVEVVAAASPSGRIVVAAAANRDDGASELHIGRLIDDAWEWLGTPLISSRKPFTHAQEPSMAFLNGDRPVVAWSEERDMRLAGLFVAAWNGSSWTRLGALTPSQDGYYSSLSPAVAVDARQHVWLAWNELDGGVRVARWDGSTWLEIGRDSLAKIVASQGPTHPGISLAIDTKGRVWVLRLAWNKPAGARLAMTRWDGAGWTAVPAPPGPEGKDSTVFSAAMILRNDAPIVAWSQSDATDNRRLYVSEWAAGDRWTVRLSGLHLVKGVSDVTDVRLAANDRQTFLISWDERGKDGRRTRLVRAYTCADGETPAAPPKSIVERDTWPTTVDEAAQRIVGALDDESKARLRAMKKDQLIQYHDGWGMGIRNSLGLWRGNEKLLDSCGRGKRADPEACSMTIIEAVWTLLQAR